MKKTVILLMSLAMLTGALCSCESKEKSSESESKAETTVSESTTNAEEATEAQTEAKNQLETIDIAELGLTEENFPKLDGSTSAIPLDAGIYASLFGMTQEDAELLTVHSTTHQSFEKLINGEVDGIYTVPISEEQQAAADEKGFNIEQIPVAAEGFVFVVNADNPVDNLTQEQLRDIYSGKITNWKEVGGNDAEIIPFQRNEDSGSQNYMKEFMKGYDLLEPEVNYIQYGMAGILDAIVENDNGINSIGYSVYSYAAEMYAQQGDIKFISVDGVKPSIESMADGEYPLLSCTYFMFSSDAPEDAPVRKLAKYLGSANGQEAVEAAGYVPMAE